MTVYYLDTSGLAKLYVRELGAKAMLRLFNAPGSDKFALLAITRVELRSALRRRVRSGDIDSESADQALGRFISQLDDTFITQDVTESILELAESVVDRHPLKASDALQLAGCLLIQTEAQEPLAFVSSDRQLLRAARAEGLTCIDPTA